jgi:hypothetical protein
LFETHIYIKYKEDGITTLCDSDRKRVAKHLKYFHQLSSLDDKALGRTLTPNPNKELYTPGFYDRLAEKIEKGEGLSAEERGILDIFMDYEFKYILPVQFLYQRIWRPDHVAFSVHPKVIKFHK